MKADVLKQTHNKFTIALLLLIFIAVNTTTVFCAQTDIKADEGIPSYVSKPLTAQMEPERKFVLKYNNDEKKYDILEMGTGRKQDLTGWVFVHDPDTPSDNWYYFDKNTKNIKTGWIEDEGSVYYLHEKKDKLTGRVYSGWHDIKGVVYFFNENNYALEKVLSKDDAKKEKIETVEDSIEKAIRDMKAAEEAQRLQQQNAASAVQRTNQNTNQYNNQYSSSAIGQGASSGASSPMDALRQAEMQGANNPADAMRQAQNGVNGLTGEDLVRLLNERNQQIR